MITSTAPAKPSPWASVISGSAVSPAGGGAAVRRTWRPSAQGTTNRLSSGAAAIAIAAALRPSSTPTTSSTPNTTREADSISTSPPYSPNRCSPARKPRAK